MSLNARTPAFPLSQFVDTIWTMTNRGMPSSSRRIYPTGAMELVIHLESRELSFFDNGAFHSVRVPLLAGPYTRSFLIDPSLYTSVMGVRFKPGAARIFFPIPAHELHNIDVPLEQFYAQEAERLYDQLLSATTQTGRLQVLERYLAAKLASARLPNPVVAHAVEQFRRHSSLRTIAGVRAETGLSHTRFIQIFREHIGVTPKVFCRVQRFQEVLQQIDRGVPANWAALAIDCGYFDQAHLIHDFRVFSGTTPRAYAQLRSSAALAS